MNVTVISSFAVDRLISDSGTSFRDGRWSDKLAGTYIDDRKRLQCLNAKTSEDAVKFAIEQAKNILNR